MSDMKQTIQVLAITVIITLFIVYCYVTIIIVIELILLPYYSFIIYYF